MLPTRWSVRSTTWRRSRCRRAVAVSSAVAMSKVTPPGPAGAPSDTVNVNVVVPALPSASETSVDREVLRLRRAAERAARKRPRAPRQRIWRIESRYPHHTPGGQNCLGVYRCERPCNFGVSEPTADASASASSPRPRSRSPSPKDAGSRHHVLRDRAVGAEEIWGRYRGTSRRRRGRPTSRGAG